MIDPHVHSLAPLVALLTQEPVPGFTADNVAARPDIVEKGLRFLNLAYTTVWIVLSVYLLSLSMRVRRLSRQVARLKERAGL